MKSIKQEEFFKLVAVYSRVSDIQTVKDIYYGMVKTISKELNVGRPIKLPHWGEFSLKIYKERTTVNVNTGGKIMLPPTPMVKFAPDYKVKKHFYDWRNRVL